MSYALVIDGTITAVRNPGRVEMRLDNQHPLNRPEGGWTPEWAALCGFLPIVDPGRPAITASQTFDPNTVELVNGTPTRVYHVRAKTAAELANDAANAQAATERQQAKQAVAALDAFITKGDANTAGDVRAQVILQARILKRLIADTFRDAP